MTNWSSELFPIALKRYPFLQWFDGIVVSGTEKTRKPFPQFYNILLDRYKVEPAEALFIDDNKRNVDAALQMGIDSILFVTPEDLRKNLLKRNILV